MPIEEKNGEIRVSAPLTEDDVAKLRAGQHVRFYGTIYTSRDAAPVELIVARDGQENVVVNVEMPEVAKE